MENASKALLIAGSVLIVIILIAMGIRVLNSTNGTTDAVETTMSAAETALFNKQFTRYEGINKKPSEVKALINTVVDSNKTNKHKVGVGVDNFYKYGNSDIATMVNMINISKTYKVELLWGDGTEHGMPTPGDAEGYIYDKTTPGVVYRVIITSEQ